MFGVLPSLFAQPATPKYYSDTLLFAFGKHYVSLNHRAFDSLQKVLKENPNYYVRIVGHTDTVGSDKMNLELSRKRSKRVTDYLVAKGIDSVRIESQWRGYHSPISTNKTATGRRYNRRVNMYVIYSKGKLVQPPPPPAPPKPKVDTVKKEPPKPIEPPKPVEPPKPKLVIDTIEYGKDPVAIICDHQTVIFGPKGTKITIPPKAFDCNERFTFELTEFFKQEDMVQKKMHTMTKKDMIDVQNIVCFKAYSNGKPQTVKSTSEIMVEVLAQKRDKEARIFVTPGTGAFTWKQYTAGNDIPSFDTDYKTYNIGIHDMGCISVGRKCENKSGKSYFVDLKLKRLYDKSPLIYYVNKEANAVAIAKQKGSAYRIENICEPSNAAVIAIQQVEGELYAGTGDIAKKQIDKMRKTGRVKVKIKFRPVTKEELDVLIKDAI